MISINLIPESIQLRQARRRQIQRWAVWSGAATLLVSVPLGLEWRHRGEADELDRQNIRLHQELSTIQAELKVVTAAADDLFLQIERADVLRSKRAWSAMLALIASAMPDQCWLASIATDPSAPSAASVHRQAVAGGAGARVDSRSRKPQQPITIDAPRKLRLTGYAANAGDPLVFVANLKDTRVFSRVALERSFREPTRYGSHFRFELVCQW